MQSVVTLATPRAGADSSMTRETAAHMSGVYFVGATGLLFRSMARNIGGPHFMVGFVVFQSHFK